MKKKTKQTCFVGPRWQTEAQSKNRIIAKKKGKSRVVCDRKGKKKNRIFV